MIIAIPFLFLPNFLYPHSSSQLPFAVDLWILIFASHPVNGMLPSWQNPRDLCIHVSTFSTFINDVIQANLVYYFEPPCSALEVGIQVAYGL